MLKSMTAFGRARATVNGKDVTAEIKSVNNRYYDCSVRISRLYGFLEDRIRTYLQQHGINRGKVEVSVTVDLLEQQGTEILIDEAYTKAYLDALCKLRDEYGLRDDISVTRLASVPGVFATKKPDDDIEKDWADISVVLDAALDAFLQRRETEGENLRVDLLGKLDHIREIVSEIEELSAQDVNGYAAKLEERLRKFLHDEEMHVDEQRILTEVAIFADRVAIDEELVRLKSHFDAFVEIVNANEPAGRKLDFLLQEMNREINTTGSKASNTEIARRVVAVKTELEKIREQIQNVE